MPPGASTRGAPGALEPLLRAKMPELDSIRGVAVLMVLGYHGLFWYASFMNFAGVPGAILQATRFGWLGVNLFFVLSGFLITGILVDSRDHRHYFRRFYVRRALRILPAFYATVFLVWFAPQQSRPYLWLSLAYASNLAPLFGIWMTYAVFWSLAVEEHFYFVWPVVARRLSSRALLGCAAAIVVLSPVARWIAFTRGTEAISYYTWLVLDGLALGAVLSLSIRLSGQSREGLSTFSAAAVTGAAVVIAGGAPFGILTRQTPVGAALMVTAAQLLFVGIIGFTIIAGTSRWRRVVNWPVLRFFGDISYGLYLIHMLAFIAYDALGLVFWPHAMPRPGRFDLVLLRFVGSAGCAVAVAWLSRRYFEDRFLRLKSRLSP